MTFSTKWSTFKVTAQLSFKGIRPPFVERAAPGMLLTGMAIAACLWFACSLTYPFGWDHGIFAWVGSIIRRGGQPYRDAWEIKGPFAYYSYALAQSLFGHNLWGVRALDGLCLAAAALCLYALARRSAGRFAAAWAGLAVVIWHAAGSYCYTAQPDGWAVMMIVAGTALSAGTDAPSPVRCLASGALIGCAAQEKPLFALFPALPCLAALTRRGPWRRVLAWATAGFFAPAALVLFWFWRAGILHDYIEQHLIYTAAVYARCNKLGAMSILRGFVTYAVHSRALEALAVPATLGAVLLLRMDRRQALLLAAWLTAALACVVLQNRYFTYHWEPVFPPVLLLAAAGIDGILRSLNAHAGRMLAICSLWPVTGLACAPLRFDVLRWTAWIRGAATTENYYADFPSAYPEMEAAAYIRSQTHEGERVAIWGWESPILFMARNNSTVSVSEPT